MVAKTVLFLSQTQFSPTIEEQRDICASPRDVIVEAADVRISQLLSGSSRHGVVLERGDRLKIYDLNSFPYPQATLVRMLTKVLKAGVSVQLCKDDIKIKPEQDDRYFKMLTLLDDQQRALHAIKTHGPDVAPGRKHALGDKEWPEIQAMLAAQVPSHKIAKHFNVGRTTLFNAIRRMTAAHASKEK